MACSFWPVARAQQKTHDRCQPWVFVEISFLRSTTPHGPAADYDDQQTARDLPNHVHHS
jgi:hypothetical protein